MGRLFDVWPPKKKPAGEAKVVTRQILTNKNPRVELSPVLISAIRAGKKRRKTCGI